MFTKRGLVRTVARSSAIRLAVIFGGFALGYVTAVQFGPAVTSSFARPAQTPATTAVRLAPEELTPLERATWLTDDCRKPEKWPQDEIAGAAIVRQDSTYQMSRVNLAAAVTGARAGTLWTLALCERVGGRRAGLITR